MAVVDSGIDPSLRGLEPVSEGVGIRVGADRARMESSTIDALGHGSVIASTIRMRTADTVLVPVRIFRNNLIAPVTAFVAAIGWAAEHDIHLLNVSVGVSKLQWRDTFEAVLAKARRAGVIVVSAAELDGKPSLPFGLDGVIGVSGDGALVDGELAVSDGVVRAPTRAGRLPGRRLAAFPSGDALAVANVTGVLANHLCEVGPQDETTCLEYLSADARY